MRTLTFLLAGVLLFASFALLAKLFSTQYPDALRIAMVTYVGLWFIIAAANMWVGVAKAGYSVGEELPIFILVFAVPVALAALAKWRMA